MPRLDLPVVEPWMTLAACRGKRTAIFYPTRGQDDSPAKAICAACPVEADCLAYALARREAHGIWGGTSARERRRRLKAAGLIRSRARKETTSTP